KLGPREPCCALEDPLDARDGMRNASSSSEDSPHSCGYHSALSDCSQSPSPQTGRDGLSARCALSAGISRRAPVGAESNLGMARPCGEAVDTEFHQTKLPIVFLAICKAAAG